MAGKGSRFSEEGFTNPKPLIDVDGLPMIFKAVNCLPKSDKNVFICLDEHIKNYDIDTVLCDYYDNTEVWGIKQVTEGQACTSEIGINNKHDYTIYKRKIRKSIISICFC